MIFVFSFDVDSFGCRDDNYEHQYLQKIFSPDTTSNVDRLEVSKSDRDQCESELRSSQYHSEEENKSRDSVLFLDLRQYVQDQDLLGFDKNIRLFNGWYHWEHCFDLKCETPISKTSHKHGYLFIIFVIFATFH